VDAAPGAAVPVVRAVPDGDAASAGAASPSGAQVEVDALRVAVAALATTARGASGWTGPDRQGLLTDLNLTIDTLSAVRSTVLVAERDAQTWRGHGDPNFAAWVGRKTRLGKRGGAAQARQADQLDTVPEVLAAVTDGRIWNVPGLVDTVLGCEFVDVSVA
jgi:hypothetical protein